MATIPGGAAPATDRGTISWLALVVSATSRRPDAGSILVRSPLTRGACARATPATVTTMVNPAVRWCGRISDEVSPVIRHFPLRPCVYDARGPTRYRTSMKLGLKTTSRPSRRSLAACCEFCERSDKAVLARCSCWLPWGVRLSRSSHVACIDALGGGQPRCGIGGGTPNRSMGSRIAANNSRGSATSTSSVPKSFAA